MSSVDPGDWMQSKGNPSAFLEVLAVWTESGEQQVKVRIGNQERTCSKRYLLATWAHLNDDPTPPERRNDGRSVMGQSASRHQP